MFIVFLDSLNVHKDVHNYPHFTDERTEAQRSGIPKDTNHTGSLAKPQPWAPNSKL